MKQIRQARNSFEPHKIPVLAEFTVMFVMCV